METQGAWERVTAMHPLFGNSKLFKDVSNLIEDLEASPCGKKFAASLDGPSMYVKTPLLFCNSPIWESESTNTTPKDVGSRVSTPVEELRKCVSVETAPGTQAASLASTSPVTPNSTVESVVTHCVVEFKLNRRQAFRIVPNTVKPIVNEFVVVKLCANNAEDAGMVVSTHDSQPSGTTEVGTILRIATPQDCSIIDNVLPQLESKALSQCHQLIHFLHIPIFCVDAEYRFDCQFVKVFYRVAPQSFTSTAPNMSRLHRELGFALRSQVSFEMVK